MTNEIGKKNDVAKFRKVDIRLTDIDENLKKMTNVTSSSKKVMENYLKCQSFNLENLLHGKQATEEIIMDVK